MADAVTARVVLNTTYRYIVHLTNVSDGTGESAVIKADKSALVAPDGSEPASLDIEWVRWNVQGFTSVRLLWDHDTDDAALVLSGSGYDDFQGRIDPTDYNEGASVKDPRTAGGTGDILLTTAGNVSGATYDITLGLRKSSS